MSNIALDILHFYSNNLKVAFFKNSFCLSTSNSFLENLNGNTVVIVPNISLIKYKNTFIYLLQLN